MAVYVSMHPASKELPLRGEVQIIQPGEPREGDAMSLLIHRALLLSALKQRPVHEKIRVTNVAIAVLGVADKNGNCIAEDCEVDIVDVMVQRNYSERVEDFFGWASHPIVKDKRLYVDLELLMRGSVEEIAPLYPAVGGAILEKEQAPDGITVIKKFRLRSVGLVPHHADGGIPPLREAFLRDPSDFESNKLACINRERAKHGLPALAKLRK